MERDRIAKTLIEATQVGIAFTDVGAAVRAAMENFADQVAPLVAPVSDLDECNAILTAEARRILIEIAATLSRKKDEIAKQA